MPTDHRAVDVLIAEKYFRRPVSRPTTACGGEYCFSDGPPWLVVPSYSASLDAANRIVATFRGDVRMRRTNGMWWVTFFVPSMEHEACAYSAPLAICLVALRSIGVVVPDA